MLLTYRVIFFKAAGVKRPSPMAYRLLDHSYFKTLKLCVIQKTNLLLLNVNNLIILKKQFVKANYCVTLKN